MNLEPGDFIKFEIKNEDTGEAEWMWLRQGRCDVENSDSIADLWRQARYNAPASERGPQVFNSKAILSFQEFLQWR